MKKFLNGDAQAVAQFFDGGDGGAVVAATDNVIHCGLGDTAHAAELVNRKIFFLAEL